VRASELINIKLSDIDLDNCQIRITKGKGKKDRIVPFPKVFMEVLAVHMDGAKKKKPHIYLICSKKTIF
jgi:integrase/recombinase XerD